MAYGRTNSGIFSSIQPKLWALHPSWLSSPQAKPLITDQEQYLSTVVCKQCPRRTHMTGNGTSHNQMEFHFEAMHTAYAFDTWTAIASIPTPTGWTIVTYMQLVRVLLALACLAKKAPAAIMNMPCMLGVAEAGPYRPTQGQYTRRFRSRLRKGSPACRARTIVEGGECWLGLRCSPSCRAPAVFWIILPADDLQSLHSSSVTTYFQAVQVKKNLYPHFGHWPAESIICHGQDLKSTNYQPLKPEFVLSGMYNVTLEYRSYDVQLHRPMQMPNVFLKI